MRKILPPKKWGIHRTKLANASNETPSGEMPAVSAE